VVVEKNPKHYSQYPSCYMKRLPPAGKMTFKSEGLRSIIS